MILMLAMADHDDGDKDGDTAGDDVSGNGCDHDDKGDGNQKLN